MTSLPVEINYKDLYALMGVCRHCFVRSITEGTQTPELDLASLLKSFCSNM